MSIYVYISLHFIHKQTYQYEYIYIYILEPATPCRSNRVKQHAEMSGKWNVEAGQNWAIFEH